MEQFLLNIKSSKLIPSVKTKKIIVTGTIIPFTIILLLFVPVTIIRKRSGILIKKLETVRINVENLLELIKQPIGEDEKKDGWTDENRIIITKYFDDLLERLKRIPPELTHHDGQITRNMDHLGIIGGIILEEAAGISNEIYSYLEK